MPGPRANFKMMAKNPNPRGGCLCSPSGKVTDCCGPFAVANGAEMYDPRNGQAVIGAGCILALARKAAPEAFRVAPPVDPSDALKTRVAEVELVLEQVRGVIGAPAEAE